MAMLTSAGIEYIRAFSGDDTPQYEVSDVFMQTLRDRAEGISCTCTDANDITVVLVLRVRVAKAARLVDEQNEAAVQKSFSQKYKQLKELLLAAEKRCGMTGSGIAIGSLNLGIDTTTVHGDETDYPYGWYE